MYRLLLPLDANAKRHPADETRLPSGFWTHLLQAVWDRILHPRASTRR